MTDTKHEELMEIGKNAMGAIRDMVAALECDYDRLEELRDEWSDLQEQIKDATAERDAAFKAGDDHETLAELNEAVGDANEAAKQWQDENMQEFADLEAAAKATGNECKDREDAEQQIMEDPLSTEYRSGWVTDKADMQAEEAKILLATGGPAVQIIVELDDGEPTRAYLQVQDWGTPWTDYYEEGIGEVLMKYVSCFCFE